MCAKQEVLTALSALPDTASFGDMKEAIDVIEANAQAMDDIRAGRVYSTDQLLSELLLHEN